MLYCYYCCCVTVIIVHVTTTFRRSFRHSLSLPSVLLYPIRQLFARVSIRRRFARESLSRENPLRSRKGWSVHYWHKCGRYWTLNRIGGRGYFRPGVVFFLFKLPLVERGLIARELATLVSGIAVWVVGKGGGVVDEGGQQCNFSVIIFQLKFQFLFTF